MGIQVFQVSVSGKPRRYVSLLHDKEHILENLARKLLGISLKAYLEEYKVKNLEPMARLRRMLYVNWNNLTARMEVDKLQALVVILVLLQVERMRVHHPRMPVGALALGALILMLTLILHHWDTNHATGRNGPLQVLAKENRVIGQASIFAGWSELCNLLT